MLKGHVLKSHFSSSFIFTPRCQSCFWKKSPSKKTRGKGPHPPTHHLNKPAACLAGLHSRFWGGLFSRLVARAGVTPGLLSGGGQFKQALSLCVQSRFMRADKDVTSLLHVFIKTLFPGGIEKQRYLFYFIFFNKTLGINTCCSFVKYGTCGQAHLCS